MLKYDDIDFFDAPEAAQVLDEIFRDDVYQFGSIPDGSIVLDVGAFYGEFAIRCCLKKHCWCIAYEPSPLNFRVAEMNLFLNKKRLSNRIILKRCAVSDRAGKRAFAHNFGHPGGSMLSREPGNVQCVSLLDEIKSAKAHWGKMLPVCVKLDCEGSEQEIFSAPAWINLVQVVVMEWHNYDGHVYAKQLSNAGFDVDLSGGGPPPRPRNVEGVAGGILCAKRKL